MFGITGKLITFAAALTLTAAVSAMAALATPDLRLGDAGAAASPQGEAQQARTMYQDGTQAEGMDSTGVTRPTETNTSSTSASQVRRPDSGASANDATLDKRATKAYGQ